MLSSVIGAGAATMKKTELPALTVQGVDTDNYDEVNSIGSLKKTTLRE